MSEWKAERWLKENYRTKLLIGAVITTVVVVGVAWCSAYKDRQVAIRSHNLDVFYKSLTCDDLPIAGDSSVAECEQAIGTFMIEEDGLFTIDPTPAGE